MPECPDLPGQQRAQLKLHLLRRARVGQADAPGHAKDVGIHRDENNKMCGDVDFADVEPVAGAITPVPGGVGPMTIAMLMNNCLEAIRNR